MVIRIQKNHSYFLKQTQFFFFTLLTLACVLLSPMPAAAKKGNPKYAAFIMDADTGLILHQENASARRHPASLTKVMTLILLFDAIDRGQIKKTDRIRFSAHAAGMPPSKVGVREGGSISVEDAIRVLVTKSANDAAAAIAEKLGGSESNFALMMTRKARAIGMKDTVFKNASGLPNPAQVTTARDLARMGYVLVKDYGRHYHYFSTKNHTLLGVSYHNHNRLMETYPGMDGIKTGFINASGFNLLASAKRNNRRLIGVVMGGKTSKSRNERMARLLDDGFSKIGSFNIASAAKMDDTGIKNVPIPQQKPIFVAGLGQVYAQVPPPQKPSSEISALVEDLVAQDAANNNAAKEPRWAFLDNGDENSVLNRMTGQGDYDNAARNRLETGIIAIAAVKREDFPHHFFAPAEGKNAKQDAQQSPKIIDASLPPQQPERIATAKSYTTNQGNEWAIQIGAFSNRESTNAAINSSLKKLPASLRAVNPVVAPLQADNGNWLFRARLSGYSKDGALKACQILPDCMPIAPHGQR